MCLKSYTVLYRVHVRMQFRGETSLRFACALLFIHNHRNVPSPPVITHNAFLLHKGLVC